ncbi:hypothetical protein [Streptomyces jeddahensis]|uniref:Lipoprotein n=1 Tax=Streptomyces jeddahensis TaxID=1716141 RepID=A0A177HLT1_9ACTN|nr:hypothetical protein [Streptomyces jeddahensis]OAH11540.1 hypothetical protein STSP_50490 [Streptomyces jeddahensis]
MKTTIRMPLAALATAAVLTATAACSASTDQDKPKDAKAAGEGTTVNSPATALSAAYKKTADVRSAHVDMVMKVPGAEGGEMTISGVQGWDPTVMDVTMEGSALTAGNPDAPEKMRMLWQDNVLYMDMGAKQAAQMDGKRWMKMDFAAIAKQAPDEKTARQMTAGLDNMNQNPAQQLALLLESPNLKHVGSAKVNGMETEHYKGTLTVEEAIKSNKAFDTLDAKERKELLSNLEKSEIEGYDIEVWVNEDELPARMDVRMDSPEGAVEVRADYTDFGAKASVAPPAASETFDLVEMLGELGAAASGKGV